MYAHTQCVHTHTMYNEGHGRPHRTPAAPPGRIAC